MSILSIIAIVFYSGLAFKLLFRYFKAMRNDETFFSGSTTTLICWLIGLHVFGFLVYGVFKYIKLIVIAGM